LSWTEYTDRLATDDRRAVVAVTTFDYLLRLLQNAKEQIAPHSTAALRTILNLPSTGVHDPDKGWAHSEATVFRIALTLRLSDLLEISPFCPIRFPSFKHSDSSTITPTYAEDEESDDEYDGAENADEAGSHSGSITSGGEGQTQSIWPGDETTGPDQSVEESNSPQMEDDSTQSLPPLSQPLEILHRVSLNILLLQSMLDELHVLTGAEVSCARFSCEPASFTHGISEVVFPVHSHKNTRGGPVFVVGTADRRQRSALQAAPGPAWMGCRYGRSCRQRATGILP
jgi:hypothetical protein